MPNLTVVGAQWGDEGKGKVVDYLARTADLVVRYQGGPNAGHTVCVEGTEHVLHQVPCGVLTPGIGCVIGCGCVVDPLVLEQELIELRRHAITYHGRLTIDHRAHIIMPYHRLIDRLREDQNDRGKIGTTGRGIGPVYLDKFGRVGIRASDLLCEETFKDKLKRNVAAANFVLMEQYKAEPVSYKEVFEHTWQATREIAAFVDDGSRVVDTALRSGRRVLFEGAQGTHLDIDLGTYPFVTPSSTWAAGVSPGTGISPVWIESVLGVTKAYATRVGMGPFPTEMNEGDAGALRQLGREFGATTGRPRRCGWLDLPVLRASVRYNRPSALAMTKLDVLDSLDQVRVCTHYLVAGRAVEEFIPLNGQVLEPQYLDFPGWREDTSKCRTLGDLPVPARRYLRRVEQLLGCPIALVSVGGERRQMIIAKAKALGWLKSN